MSATRQDERVSKYGETLQYRWKPIGTWERIWTRGGFELKTAPPRAIPKPNRYLSELEAFLHETRLDFMVYENGEVWVLVPHKQKYGYILGQVAHAYKFAMEALA